MPDELAELQRVLHHRHGGRGDARVSEIGPHKFQPGNMTKVLMDDYSAEVQPKARRRNASASFTFYRHARP